MVGNLRSFVPLHECFLAALGLLFLICFTPPAFSIGNINHPRLAYVTQIYNHAYSWQTLRSFAACTAEGGCSCYMLSPSIVQTAAHCIQRGPGYPHIYSISFRTYCNQDYTCHVDETFNCPSVPFYSIQASDSDIALLECDPNSQGVLPGDKYGFIDTLMPSTIELGEPVASFWNDNVVTDPKDPRMVKRFCTRGVPSLTTRRTNGHRSAVIARLITGRLKEICLATMEAQALSGYMTTMVSGP